MKKNLAKRDPIKNYFPLPNEIYQLGLSSGAIAVYGYLLRIEDRTTYQCYPSYSTIGSAVGMSKNTVRKYVAELEERRLIQTEPTSITTVDGRKRNGSLRYTILPIQFSIEQFYERQLNAAEQDVLLRKMEEYCQQQTGMSLHDYAQQFREEPEQQQGPVMKL